MAPAPSDAEINAMSSLALAHIGDAVYELLARSWLMLRGRQTSRALHGETVKIVRARAQAGAARRLLDELTDEESEVYRRGRNARSHSIPRGALAADYHAATALEALFGWLYLKGRRARINELFEMIMELSDASD